MAKKKSPANKSATAPTRDIRGQAVRLLARLVGQSRDINQTDRLELARLAKALKD